MNDSDLVTLEPWDTSALTPGDIVLVKVNGRDYLHHIKAVNGSRFLIGNNRGGTNGWVGPNGILWQGGKRGAGLIRQVATRAVAA